MSEPFIGEIRSFSFGFAPNGWATCDGQTLNISQNQALFALLGTIYGGNGTTNFQLPDLRGRTMISRNNDYPEGHAGGAETVALTAMSQLPPHTHALNVNSTAGGTNTPSGSTPSAVADPGNTKFAYATAKASGKNLAAGSIASAGNGAAHENMQPSLVINYCIALTGIWPSRQ
jgi:microcystin-dependent protein